MKVNLAIGQAISVVTIQGVQYVSNALTMGTMPFTDITTRHDVPVQRFDIHEVLTESVLTTDNAPSYLDADGNAYYKLSEQLTNTIVLV